MKTFLFFVGRYRAGLASLTFLLRLSGHEVGIMSEEHLNVCLVGRLLLCEDTYVVH